MKLTRENMDKAMTRLARLAAAADEKEARYPKGPMKPPEKKKLMDENPEFKAEHERNKDKFKKDVAASEARLLRLGRMWGQVDTDAWYAVTYNKMFSDYPNMVIGPYSSEYSASDGLSVLQGRGHKGYVMTGAELLEDQPIPSHRIEVQSPEDLEAEYGRHRWASDQDDGDDGDEKESRYEEGKELSGKELAEWRKKHKELAKNVDSDALGLKKACACDGKDTPCQCKQAAMPGFPKGYVHQNRRGEWVGVIEWASGGGVDRASFSDDRPDQFSWMPGVSNAQEAATHWVLNYKKGNPGFTFEGDRVPRHLLARQRLTHQAASTVNLFTAVYGDGALYGATEDSSGRDPRYWARVASEDGFAIYELHNVPIDLAAKLVDQGTPAQQFSDGYQAWDAAKRYARNVQPQHMASDLTAKWGRVLTAGKPSGLYGYTKKVQADCETATRKLARVASKLARVAYQKDERVAPFLGTHSKRANSLSAKILTAAMKDLGPKVASQIEKVAASSGAANAAYLNGLSPQMKAKILNNVADHYGVSIREIEVELTDPDAEALYEYIANDNALRMQVYRDFSQMRLASDRTAGLSIYDAPVDEQVRYVMEQLAAAGSMGVAMRDLPRDGAYAAQEQGLAEADRGRLYRTQKGKQYRLAAGPPLDDIEPSGLNTKERKEWSTLADKAAEAAAGRGSLTDAEKKRGIELTNKMNMPDREKQQAHKWFKGASVPKDAGYSMYGFRTKTATLGLNACAALKTEAGRIASDLHRRRRDKHAAYTGFLTEHGKQARCLYSKMLCAGYPDAEMRLASMPEPEGVDGWLVWED